MPLPTEFDLQRALCGWLDGWPDRSGIPKVTPALAPGVVYFHVPNGGGRSAIEGARLKQSGVKAGVPDLIFLAHQRFYCLELKEPGGNGRLSPAQLAMHPRLIDAGVTALATLDNLAEAKAWCVRNFLALNVDK
ncbi:VRR-NUC domain-containing protein [Bradyrhizobium liaoningense]